MKFRDDIIIYLKALLRIECLQRNKDLLNGDDVNKLFLNLSW